MDKTSDCDTAAEGQFLALTIAEMMKKYPKEEVEKAMFRRNYKKARDQTIRDFEDQIRNGINVETCKEGLQELLETTPSEPPVDPTEPSDLDLDVLWRIRILKYFLHADCDEDLVNLEAVLDAYRHGNLKVDNNQVTVWFSGHMTMGPLSKRHLNRRYVFDKVPEWQAKYGPGRIWIEETTVATAKLNSTTLAPSNEFSHHVFDIRARLVEVVQFITLSNILDDTSSAYLELFRRSDCNRLGLTQAYTGWNNDVILDTANGTVQRKSFELEVQLLVNGDPFGPVSQVTATITPGSGEDELRCSGMFLRQALFTATSPNGQGILYISDKKTGVSRPLPAV